jgi:hypothetical protein
MRCGTAGPRAQVEGADSFLQAGFAGAKFDRAMMSLGAGEDDASWAVDGIRRRRLHRRSDSGSESLRFSRRRSQGGGSFDVGDQVEGQYLTGSWYPAVILSCNVDGTYTLQWNDGDSKDRNKRADQLRYPGGDAPPAEALPQADDADGGAGALDEGGDSAEWGGQWQQGDVVGLACDLSTGQMLVSVNGNFSPPNGVAFAEGLQPGQALGPTLFPVLSGRGVKAAVNFGADPVARPFRGPRWPEVNTAMRVVRGDAGQVVVDAALSEVEFRDTVCVVGSPQLAAAGGRVYYEIELLQVRGSC